MNKVSIRKIKSSIKDSLELALKDIGGIETIMKPTDRVMLKPNINGDECVTNIKLVDSLIELLKEHSINNIVIAESTFGNAQVTNHCFKVNGYFDLAKKHNIELINLNSSEVIEKEVTNPQIISNLKIAKEVFEVDKIINLPVMKVHYATGITLCLKNLKGLLVGDEKRHFHDIGLDKAIVDLNSVIKPDLNIVDCTDCMERMGPKGGDIVKLNTILVGIESASVDYIGMKIMNYSLDEVNHLKLFIESNMIDISNIQTLGNSIEEVMYKFKKADLNNIFDKKKNIINHDACSSCMNALILSLQLAGEINLDNKTIYLGSKFNQCDYNETKRVAFGKCCIKNLKDFDYKVIGCPPYPFELKKIIESK
jgi:uncharacterized protein (DUF362 family)